MKETQKVALDSCIIKDNLITVKQSDCGSRFLEIQLTANDVPIDLTDCTICLYCKKEDGSIAFSQAVTKDSSIGLVEAELSSQMLSVSGETLCEVKIYNTQNTLLSSMPFTIRIVGSISDDNAIESTNEFSALTQAISKLSGFSSISGAVEESLTNVNITLGDMNKKLELANQIINSSVPDNSVTLTKIANSHINVFDKTKASNGYINEDGIITQHDEIDFYSSTFIPVSSLQNYTISAGSGRGYAFYDKNYNFISRTQIDSSTGPQTTITVPQNSSIKFLRIQIEEKPSVNSHVDKFMVCFGETLPDNYIDYGVTATWLNPVIKEKSIKSNFLADASVCETSLKNEGINVFNFKTASFGYIDENGLISPNSDLNIYTSDYIKVSSGEYYTLSSGSARAWACYDENKNYIENSRIQIDTSYGGKRTIKIPPKVSYIRVQAEEKNELNFFIEKFMICYGDDLPDTFVPHGTNAQWIRPYDKLYGKTLAVLGDSIAAAKPENTHVYGMFERVADEHGMQLYNCAVNAATMSILTTNNNNNIFAQTQNLPSELDYIFVQGGLNDIAFSYLGSISEGYDSELVENTFCGGLEKLLRFLITTYPTTLIAYITTHKIPNSPYLKIYMNRAKEICEKYSIPVLDFYSLSGFCTELPASSINLFVPNLGNEFDGVHPNSLGYKKLAHRLSEFLLTPLSSAYSEQSSFQGVEDFSITSEKLARSCVDADKILKGTVSTYLTDFIKSGKNLIDISKLKLNTSIDDSTGLEYTKSMYNTTDWIPVKGNTSYVFSYNGSQPIYKTLFFDKNKIIISKTSLTTFTTPENCEFLKIVTFSKTNLQLELGTTATDYTKFHNIIDKLSLENIDEKSITSTQLANSSIKAEHIFTNSIHDNEIVFTTCGKNLIDNQSNIIKNSIKSTQYIKVQPNTEYTYSASNYVGTTISFFDINKNSIFTPSSTPFSFTTPQNAHFVKISCPSSTKNLQLELGTQETAFEEYKRKIENLDISTNPTILTLEAKIAELEKRLNLLSL